MDFLAILFIIIAIVGNLQRKKQKQEEAARRKQAADATRSAAPAPPAQPARPAARPVDPRFPDFSSYEEERTHEKQATQVDLQEQQRKAEARRQTMAQARRDAQAAAAKRVAAVAEGETSHPGVSPITESVGTRLEETKGRRHTLEASSLTGHSHMETSITGQGKPCPPEAATAAAPKTAATALGFQTGNLNLKFDQPAVVAGLLYAEILGKPKALQR